MAVSIKKRPKSLLWVAIFVSILFFSTFFMDFFTNIEKFIKNSWWRTEWRQEITCYANIKHQIFNIKQFPYYSPVETYGTDTLFANPETSVLSPINLLLPFVSIYNFFIYHVCFHYIIALLGIILLRKYFKLPYLAILPMFFLLGFNGRILSNYYMGHSMFITYLYFPLLLYFYLNLMEQRKNVTLYAALTAFTMTMIFYEGGVHTINWIILFFFFDLLIIVINILKRKGKYINHPRQVITNLFPPIRNVIITFIFFVLFSAIKLLPVMASFGKWNPSRWRITGYKNIIFFLQTFYQSELGSLIHWKELNIEEGYNFIGIEASLLAILSICYALFLAKVPTIKKLAIIGIILSILSFGDIFHDLFGSIPVLRGERVSSRFIFITIALLALLIPISINHVLLRLKASLKLREITMLLVGIGIFLRLYYESKKWMIASETQFDPYIPLSWRHGGGIEPHFFIGLAISSLSILGVVVFLLFQKRRSII